MLAACPSSPISQAAANRSSFVPVYARVQNTGLGAIEVSSSLDGPWTLVARVELPALGDAPQGLDSRAGQVSITSAGAVLSFAKGRGIKLIPSRPGTAPRDVLTVRPPDAYARLCRLLRDGDIAVSLVHGGRIVALHDGYAPSDGDWWMLQMSSTAASAQELAAAIAGLGADYRQHAAEALRAKGGKTTKGFLRVSANLKPGVSAASVTFLLDGTPVALVNRPPFQVLWDTRDWADGEHMIEVRALDERGLLVSRTKTLVLTANGG